MAPHTCSFYQLRKDSGHEHFPLLQTTHLTSNVDSNVDLAKIVSHQMTTGMVSIVSDALLDSSHVRISKLIAPLIAVDFVN